jgi:hypothetical protein
MLPTCRNVISRAVSEPLNHSSTTSLGDRPAAAGRDRTGRSGLAGDGDLWSSLAWRCPGAPITAVLVRLKPSLPLHRAHPGASGSTRAGLTAYAGRSQARPSVEVLVSTSGADSSAGAVIRPRLSAAQLLAAKNTGPIRSLDDLAADTFESDEELAEFLAFTYAERHRDLA